MCFNANGDSEEEANEKWSPKIPIFQFIDSCLAITGYHEQSVFDFGGNIKEFSFLDEVNSTRVVQES